MQEIKHGDGLGAFSVVVILVALLWLLYQIIFYVIPESQNRKKYKHVYIGGSLLLYDEELDEYSTDFTTQ